MKKIGRYLMESTITKLFKNMPSICRAAISNLFDTINYAPLSAQFVRSLSDVCQNMSD